MCQAAYFQLHNIAKIRHCLTTDACKTIVHGLVTSKVDNVNSVSFGINGRLLQKLQQVQKLGGGAETTSSHASVDSAALAAGSMARNIQDTDFCPSERYMT